MFVISCKGYKYFTIGNKKSRFINILFYLLNFFDILIFLFSKKLFME